MKNEVGSFFTKNAHSCEISAGRAADFLKTAPGFLAERGVEFAPDIFKELLAQCALAHIEVAESVQSTNLELAKNMRAALRGAPLKILIAKEQTAGRGRLGRFWHSETGKSVCMSMGFLFEENTRFLEAVTILCGLEICKNLSAALCADFKLKWPNDIYLNGRKLSGMLAQMSAGEASDGLYRAVFGVGVNCDIKNPPAELAGLTANLSEVAPNADLSFIAALVAAGALAGVLRLKQFAEVADACGPVPPLEYARFDYLAGKTVRASLGDKEIEGTARGISAGGELLIEIGGKNPHIVKLNSGEAVLKK